MNNKRKDLVYSFTERCIEDLKKNHQFSTALHYASGIRSLKSYRGTDDDFSFKQFNRSMVSAYNAYLLSKGLAWNTISFYNRVLRTICNKAQACGIGICSDAFDGAYTKVALTRKRAVSGSVISQIVHADLTNQQDLAFTRDIFLFSYATQGMAFVDIAYLRWQDISNDTIHYCRKKTGQSIEIHIEPITLSIINRYRKVNSPYLFPILKSVDQKEAFDQYRTQLSIYNRNLKRLGKAAGVNNTLTSYVARHSWATSAIRNHIPVSVISQALGHSSERTTRIYLGRLHTSEVTKANRKILRDLM